MLALLSIFYIIMCGDFSMKIMTVTKKIVYMIDFYHTIYMFFFCSISFNAHASLEHFLKPLEFNKKGITHFFGSTFNASEYAQDFLPYSLMHFSEFLSVAHKTADPYTYTKEITKLWTEKYKEVLFVSADTLITFLQDLPKITKKSFIITHAKEYKNTIKSCLYKAVLHKFALLKNNPDLFFDTLADEIIALPLSSDHLVTFLESLLNKLLWAEEDKNYIFHMFVRLDTLLYNLYDKHRFIDEDGFYRLGNSLLCRLKYYIEIAEGDLGFSFYELMSKNIEEDSLHIFAVEEIEDGIISRKDFLKNMLVRKQKLF